MVVASNEVWSQPLCCWQRPQSATAREFDRVPASDLQPYTLFIMSREVQILTVSLRGSEDEDTSNRQTRERREGEEADTTDAVIRCSEMERGKHGNDMV